MRKMKTTIVSMAAVAGLAAAAAVALPAAAAPAAPASRTPVVYTQGMGAKWGGPARRPHAIGLGADFGISRIAWSSWTNKGAFGHGHLVACAGAQGPCAIFRAGIRLSMVKQHKGTKFFATMVLTGKHRRTQRLVIRNGAWTLVTAGYRAGSRG
jgi:ABC-type transport system substrate-binding protein